MTLPLTNPKPLLLAFVLAWLIGILAHAGTGAQSLISILPKPAATNLMQLTWDAPDITLPIVCATNLLGPWINVATLKPIWPTNFIFTNDAPQKFYRVGIQFNATNTAFKWQSITSTN